MSLDEKDLDRIERISLRSAGDIAEALGRGVERLEERIDNAEMAIRSEVAQLAEHVAPPGVYSAT